MVSLVEDLYKYNKGIKCIAKVRLDLDNVALVEDQDRDYSMTRIYDYHMIMLKDIEEARFTQDIIDEDGGFNKYDCSDGAPYEDRWDF